MKPSFQRLEYVRASKPPKIRFHISLTNETPHNQIAFGFKAEIRMTVGKKVPYIQEPEIYLGEAIDPHQTVLRLKPKDSNDFYIDYTLFPYTKNIIEDIREGDIMIKLLLRYYLEQRGEEGTSKGLTAQWGHVTQHRSNDIIIHSSQWSDILSQAGYDSFQIIEIPVDYGKIKSATGSLGDDDLQGRLKKSTVHLDKIMGLMDEGRWPEAVGECRICLEAMTKGNGVRKEINSILESSGFPEKNVNSFRILLEQLKSFTSLKHHAIVDGEAKELIAPMDREDALFAVSTLTTMINLLARKYQKLAVYGV